MKDKQWDDHKYIARVKVKRKTGSNKDTWRYFYDKAEYQAYLKGLRENGDTDKTKVASVDKALGNPIETELGELSVKAREIVDDNRKRKILYDTNTDTYYIQDKRSISDKAKEAVSNVLDGLLGKSTLSKIQEAAREWVENQNIVFEDSKKRLSEKLAEYEKRQAEEQTSRDENTDNFLDAVLDKKNAPSSDEEDQAAINPNYDPYDPYGPYNNNCYACTVAYELRQRGYDVEAIPDKDGESIYNILSYYNGEKPSTYVYISNTQRDEAAEKIKENLLKHPEGSRGQYIVAWSNGGAHSMAWEITNGEVLIRDCQSNETYTVEQITPYTYETIVFRTDNVDINPEALSCVKNRNSRKGEK